MSFGGTTPPTVRHLLLCQHIGYDLDKRTYSLDDLITALEPGGQYPFVVDELWVFIQAFGDPGQYDLWFSLVRVDEEGDGVDEETMFGPWVLIIHADVYIESRGWKLLNIPFPAPGLYEVQVHCGPDILAREQLLLVEV
jgi:hypothetical protein